MKIRLMAILMGLVLVVAAVIALQPRANAVGTTNKPIDFTLQDTTGNKVTLSSYRGKVVVLDIWATWCGYCVREIPGLIQLQQDAIGHKQPVQFIGISIDQNQGAVTQFAQRTHFNYPVVFARNDVMKLFGDLPGVPDKFIIDKNGVMVERLVGAMDKADLQKHIDKYLK